MRLKSLTLKGFRNLDKITLDFDPKTSVFAFTGDNGQGKTNLLEAIFLLSVSKSFRTRENSELVGFEKDFCSLTAATDNEQGEQTFDLIVTRNPAKKTLKMNGVQKKAADYVGKFNVVFFSPDDIGMIHLSPSVRRRYLDLLLSQLDRDYLKDSLKYQAILKQRNSLLKQLAEGPSKTGELDFWDSQLAEVGLRITQKRRQIVEDLNLKASVIYADVSDEKQGLSLHYLPSFALDHESISTQLKKGRSRDLMTGASQVGPHRDDLQFFCNGHDMASFASRGEWRSLVLALKFAEIELIKEKKGEWPVVLLDDVFSELDDRRQKYLFNVLKNTQIFVTTTHPEFLDVIEANKQIFVVSEGRVKETVD